MRYLRKIVGFGRRKANPHHVALATDQLRMDCRRATNILQHYIIGAALGLPLTLAGCQSDAIFFIDQIAGMELFQKVDDTLAVAVVFGAILMASPQPKARRFGTKMNLKIESFAFGSLPLVLGLIGGCGLATATSDGSAANFIVIKSLISLVGVMGVRILCACIRVFPISLYGPIDDR